MLLEFCILQEHLITILLTKDVIALCLQFFQVIAFDLANRIFTSNIVLSSLFLAYYFDYYIFLVITFLLS